MPAPDASARRGFTLLELVIALAILAMIAGSVAVGIRLAVGSIERGEAVTRDAARLRAAVGIFERALMSADPLPIPVGDNTTAYFAGEEKSVRFLTAGAPSAIHGGGLRLISFFERSGGEGSGIAVATASPFRAEGAERWEGTEKARILVPGGGGARLLLLRGPDEGRGVGMAPGVGSEGDGPSSRRRAGGVQRAVPVRPPEDRVRGPGARRGRSRRMKGTGTNRGIALLLVLWALVLLGTLALGFSLSMRTEAMAARNGIDETRAYFQARTGVNRAVVLLASLPADNVLAATIAGEDGDASYEVRVESESGKVDVNLVGEEVLLEILKKGGLPEEEAEGVRDAILDWRDEDDVPRPRGAERAEYGRMTEPIAPRNGKIRGIGELMYVKGVTKEFYEAFLSRVFTVHGNSAQAELPPRAGDRPAIASGGFGRGGGPDRGGPQGGTADLRRGPGGDGGRGAADRAGAGPPLRRILVERLHDHRHGEGGKRRDPRRAVPGGSFGFRGKRG